MVFAGDGKRSSQRSEREPSPFDAYYQWLGVPPEEQPPNHYRLLGLKLFEENCDVIEHAADRQMAHVRTFQAGSHGALSQRLLNELSAVRLCLLNPQKKADYDSQLRALLDSQSQAENTSTQVRGLQELGDSLTQDAARAASNFRTRPSSAALFAGGAVILAVLAVVVVWKSSQEKVGSGPMAVSSEKRPAVSRQESGSAATSIPSPQLLVSPAKEESGTAKAAQSGQEQASGMQTAAASEKPVVSRQQSGGDSSPAPGPASSATNAQSVAAAVPSRVSTSPREAASSSPATSVQPPAMNAGARSQLPTAVPQAPATAPVPSSPAPSPAPLIPASASPASRTSSPTLRPVPDEAARSASLRQAQGLFRDEYAKAKKPAEKAELAKKLLKQAEAPAEASTERYVLLCLARDVALTADDEPLASQAIDALATTYAVDGLALKSEALHALAKSAKTLPAHKRLCEHALSLGRDALAADRFDAADALAKLAYAEAGKVRDKELVQRSRSLAKDQQDAAKAFAAVEEAFKTLKDKPEDPAANLMVGKYSCFVKRDWPAGLVQLTKGDDSALKSLAEEERKIALPEWEPVPGVMPPDPPPAASALRVADGWWDQGQAAVGKQRDQILFHAGYWYRQSFGADTSPLVARRIDSRLEQIKNVRSQYPPPPLAVAPCDAREARLHQRRWAEHLDIPWSMANTVGMKLVLIPPGEFDMGSTATEIAKAQEDAAKTNEPPGYSKCLPAELPRHHVRITRPVYLGTYPVTQTEYEKLMGTNPAAFNENCVDGTAFKPPLGGVDMKHRPEARQRSLGQDTRRHPVETVSWNDAQEFCRRLSATPGEQAAGRMYRLPSEAEWEYACRALVGPDGLGDDERALAAQAWFRPHASSMTHPVGQKLANAWGLYDMLGNVCQWCTDCFAIDYYQHSTLSDPSGPPGTPRDVQPRSLRGGEWRAPACYSRPARRAGANPGGRYETVGFRVAVPL